MTTLVVAPHPDDEVLGTGGTIARAVAEGADVCVVIVTRGDPAVFGEEQVRVVRQEMERAHEALGVKRAISLDFPAAQLDQVPHAKLNAALHKVLRETKATTMYVPFRGDIHLDHRLVFDSCMVAARPTGGMPVRNIFAYETLSETNWNAGRGISATFVPDTFADITETLDAKLAAMKAYASQLREFPDERSLEALTALARQRGATVGLPAAEAFMTIRRIV